MGRSLRGVDGEPVQRGVQPSGRARGRLAQEPPALRGEAARRIFFAGISERPQRTIEQHRERLERAGSCPGLTHNFTSYT